MIDFLMVDSDKYDDGYVERLVKENPINCTEFTVYDISIGEQVWKCKAMLARNKIIFVDFQIATFDGVKHLRIHLTAGPHVDVSDEDLHSFKIQLKNRLLQDWKRCVWLEDEQAALISAQLYSMFYQTENLVRRFLNNVLVTIYGPDWWDRLAPYNLKQKYQGRHIGYKRSVPSFANVSDHLLSIDVDDLVRLMKTQKKTLVLSDDDKHQITTLLEQSAGAEIILSELRSKLRVHTDLWKAVFQRFLSAEFELEWETFYKNRNHVAHNKLIDLSGRNKMIANIEAVNEIIKSALKKFESEILSAEQQEIEDIMEDIRQMQFEEARKSIIEDATGVSVLDSESIARQFDEDIHEFLANVSDELYFRRGVNVTIQSVNLLSEECLLATISSIVGDSKVDIVATPDFDDSPGGSSTVTISIQTGSYILGECQLEYVNGCYEETDTGVFSAVIENQLITGELMGFVEEVIKSCDEVVTKPIDLLQRAHALALRNGGFDPIADFTCSECGERGICLDKSILPLGECAFCGAEHEVAECKRCQSVIDSQDSRSYVGATLCEKCYLAIQEQ